MECITQSYGNRLSHQQAAHTIKKKSVLNVAKSLLISGGMECTMKGLRMEKKEECGSLCQKPNGSKLTKDELVNELLIMKYGRVPIQPYKRHQQEALVEHIQLAVKSAKERKYGTSEELSKQ